MTGHAAHDQADYVPEHLWAEWGAKDPIAQLQHKMVSRGWSTQPEIERTFTDIKNEVDAAIEWAEKSPYPDPSELMDGVYEN